MLKRFLLCVGSAACLFGYSACGDSSAGSGAGATGTGGSNVDNGPGAGGGDFTVLYDPVPESPGGVQELGPENDKAPPNFVDCGNTWVLRNVFTMSADDSNSMGSPGYSREMLTRGLAPDPALVRTHELLNYYNARYTPPINESLEVYAHMQAGVAPGEHRIQIGVQAPPPPAIRRPMTITIVVDTSQSMADQGI